VLNSEVGDFIQTDDPSSLHFLIDHCYFSTHFSNRSFLLVYVFNWTQKIEDVKMLTSAHRKHLNNNIAIIGTKIIADAA